MVFRKNISVRVTRMIFLVGFTVLPFHHSYALDLGITLPSITTPVVSTPAVNINVSVPIAPVPIPISVPSVSTPVVNINTTSSVPAATIPVVSATTNIIPSVVSTLMPGDSVLQSSNTSVQVSTAQNTGDPQVDGSQIIKNTIINSGGQQTVQHIFTTAQNWSGYNKIGFWILSDVPCNAGDTQFILSSTKDLTNAAESLIINLPDLPAHQWKYVSLDLPQSTKLGNIVSYGFSLKQNKLVSLTVRPLERGPGTLHHFKIQAQVGNTKKLVKIIAEDAHGLPLDFGTNIYSGLKNLTFRSSTTTLVSANISPVVQAAAKVNFTSGVSDIISLDAVSPQLATANLDVTDGTVNTAVGDFTYNLLNQSDGSGNDNPIDMSMRMSSISVSPNPAVIRKPVLVTLTLRDAMGNPMVLPALSVQAKISGADTKTITLGRNIDGTYEGIYTPLTQGLYQVTGYINNQKVGSDTDGTNDGVYNLLANIQSTTGTPQSGNTTRGTGSAGGAAASYFGGGYAGSYTTAASPTSCSPYLLKFIKRGENNDPMEVMKLQMFLRDRESLSLVKITGVYDAVTFNAVKVFQSKYVQDVLTPWQTAVPTGYVYIQTLKKINDMYCRGTSVQQLPVPIASSACPLFLVTEWQGKQDAEVTKIQQFLVKNGFMSSPSSWGYYGTMTVNAVKQFQTKYASEILWPVDQKTPTGRWLAMTMKKANQLAGCLQ